MGTDLSGILSNPIGQPLATIFFNSFGKTGTLALWTVIVVVQFMMGSSILLASSRQTFAFARDGGLPFSSLICRVNRHTKTPVNGVWFAAFVSLLLGLLAFAGSSAVSAIFSLGVAGQNLAYSIPITARFAFQNNFKPGPFYLGRFGLPVAIIAVTWMAFTTIVFLFPSTPQTTPAEMNYTIVVLGGVLALALAYYYCPKYGGVYWFNGPTNTLRRQQEEQEERERRGRTASLGSTEKVIEDVPEKEKNVN